MKRAEHNPLRLDVAALAAEAGRLSGDWPLAALPRLAASAHDGAAAGTGPGASWTVEGATRRRPGAEPEVWLHLQARATLALECQRCLAPVAQELVVDRQLRFVATEEAAAALDADSDEDVLALPRVLDLRELVEDELLLALPLVPRHATCPQPLVAAPSADDEPVPEREHPFAALRALKRSDPGH